MISHQYIPTVFAIFCAVADLGNSCPFLVSNIPSPVIHFLEWISNVVAPSHPMVYTIIVQGIHNFLGGLMQLIGLVMYSVSVIEHFNVSLVIFIPIVYNKCMDFMGHFCMLGQHTLQTDYAVNPRSTCKTYTRRGKFDGFEHNFTQVRCK